MFLFRNEFKLTAKELNSIRSTCIFLTRVYVKYWFGCEQAIEAPRRDLQLIKDAIDYFDKRVSAVLLDKIKNHLWYLSEEAVGLALFDSEVSLETKRKMVKAMEKTEDDDLPCSKKFETTIEDIMKLKDKDLSYFVTSKTKRLFVRLEISSNFLQFDPSSWNEIADYSSGLQICKNLSVVNDPAERAVKLITDFNRALTYDENDKQYLLQIVEYYRQKFPSHRKSSLLSQKN